MAIIISNDIIFPWAGAVADIPAGWSRETTLDSKYPKATANDYDPNVTGGATTHSHVSSGHTHNLVAHNHGTTIDQAGDSDEGNTNDPKTLVGTHNHPTSSTSSISGGSLQTTSPSWAAASNDPAYHAVIFLKSTGGELADDMIALWGSTSAIPDGFTLCTGGGGTVDLRNKFLKGAATGLGAGATGGGDTHIHAIDHDHTVNSHTHAGTTSTAVHVPTPDRSNIGTATNSLINHTHAITLAATTDVLTAYSATAGGLDTVEPAYRKLAAIQNTSGAGAESLRGVIGMYLGSLVSIPAGWILCNGENGTPDMGGKYLKIADILGNVGVTGGNNTHKHTDFSHTHAASGTHTHTGTTGNDNATGKHATGGDNAMVRHTHVVSAVAAVTATYSASNIDSDTVSNEPAYRTVAYVMFTGTPGNSERSFEVSGYDVSSSERGMEVAGIYPAEERRFEITGKVADNSERGFEISGLLVWTAESKPVTPTWTVPNRPTPG